MKTPNKLIHSNNPYLLQHAYNPVDWQVWGDEAIQEAVRSHKLLIISIGYAACHWCHVMEHESFEDLEVAKVMNEGFICIKVDREERPDIDAIYMNAAHLTTGRGGWPLNAIALPDGTPVFAATYFPKHQWIQVLQHFVEAWNKQPEELQKAAENLTRGVRSMDKILPQSTTDQALPEVNGLMENILAQSDTRHGGLGSAPKFPMPSVWEFLWRAGSIIGNDAALKQAHLTCYRMAMGGIYDQAGGGFARYSTDEFWFAPHFEKMLYDNAQLIPLYALAFQKTGWPLYRKVVDESIGFLERELCSDDGGFYSSLDADSEGEEGKFYCLTEAELNEIWKEHSPLLKKYFSVMPEGNWEHKNILFLRTRDEEILKESGITAAEWEKILREGKEAIMQARETRPRPALDDKKIAAWNALVLSGLCTASPVWEEEKWNVLIEKNLDFIRRNFLREDYSIMRIEREGKISVPGFLDDYAFMAQAFLDLFCLKGHNEFALIAANITEKAIAKFYDPASGYFYYTGNEDKHLITRTKELQDNVIPASNSAMAKVLFLLSKIFYRDDWEKMASKMLSGMTSQIQKYPSYHSNWAILDLWNTRPFREIVIIGPEAGAWVKNLRQKDLENCAIFFSKEISNQLPAFEGKGKPGTTVGYVCEGRSCGAPVMQWEELLEHR